MSDVDPVTPDDEDEIFGSSWDCAECGAVVDFNLDQCQPCGGSEGKWDTANPVDPVTPGDDAIDLAYNVGHTSMRYDAAAWPMALFHATPKMLAAAAPLLVAEAVAAERANTRRDLIEAAQCVIPDERREWLTHWLARSFAAGSETTPAKTLVEALGLTDGQVAAVKAELTAAFAEIRDAERRAHIVTRDIVLGGSETTKESWSNV